MPCKAYITRGDCETCAAEQSRLGFVWSPTRGVVRIDVPMQNVQSHTVLAGEIHAAFMDQRGDSSK